MSKFLRFAATMAVAGAIFGLTACTGGMAGPYPEARPQPVVTTADQVAGPADQPDRIAIPDVQAGQTVFTSRDFIRHVQGHEFVVLSNTTAALEAGDPANSTLVVPITRTEDKFSTAVLTCGDQFIDEPDAKGVPIVLASCD